MVAVPGKGGRRHHPLERKLRRGEIKPEDVTMVEVPEPDEWPPEPIRPLGESGREMFDHVWRSCPWLSVADLDTVQQYAELSDDRMVARTQWLNNISENWRAGVMARKTEIILASIADRIGLTPSSRASMGLALARTAAVAQTATVGLQQRSAPVRKQTIEVEAAAVRSEMEKAK